MNHDNFPFENFTCLFCPLRHPSMRVLYVYFFSRINTILNALSLLILIPSNLWLCLQCVDGCRWWFLYVLKQIHCVKVENEYFHFICCWIFARIRFLQHKLVWTALVKYIYTYIWVCTLHDDKTLTLSPPPRVLITYYLSFSAYVQCIICVSSNKVVNESFSEWIYSVYSSSPFSVLSVTLPHILRFHFNNVTFHNFHICLCQIASDL